MQPKARESDIFLLSQPSLASGFSRWLPAISAIVAIVAFVIVGALTHGEEFNSASLEFTIAGRYIPIAIMGLGVALVLLVGEIDISLAPVAALCAGIMVVLSHRLGYPATLAVGTALLAGAGLGAMNGVLVAVVRIPAAYATLIGALVDFLCLAVLRQILYPFTVLQIDDPMIWDLGSVWVSLPVLVALSLIIWLILRHTTFGQGIYRLGRDAEAPAQAGGRAVGTRIAVFAMASTLAAAGGIVYSASIISTGIYTDPRWAVGPVAAAVIGGISVFGGRGSTWGVFLGSVVVACIWVAGLFLAYADTSPLAEAIIDSLAIVIVVTAAIVTDVLIRYGRRGSIWGVVLGCVVIGCIWVGAFFVTYSVDIANRASATPVVPPLVIDGVALVAGATVAVSREVLLRHHR